MKRAILGCLVAFACTPGFAQNPYELAPGNGQLAEYFRLETERLAERNLESIQSAEDWKTQQPQLRAQLFEMLGLDPLPERTPLEPRITGTIDHEDFTVEKITFQSRPGLYGTGNLYLPKTTTGKAPTVLYVCGHARAKEGDTSFGNKTAYQHHGIWFARNGYVCLMIDTLQLGEIEGIHHGTYRHDRWWWNARGYTPAGVEAWNCIRALDYLETRPEVDASRFAVTGRSGGGAYSWWAAALDERIKVAAPVAGIASLQNHVVDGTVEGHCDCMFHVNTYGWDFPTIAALVAPRPLLIINTDKDRIFPLDGVVDVYFKTRRIYELLGVRDHIGLAVYEGPHKDTQPLRVNAFHWFDRFLKDGELTDELPDTAAPKLFEPSALRVFDQNPTDEENTTIDESFVPLAAEWSPGNGVPDRSGALKTLRSKCFRGWPDATETPKQQQLTDESAAGIRLVRQRFESQAAVGLDLFIAHRDTLKPDELELVVLNVLDETGWQEFLATFGKAFPNTFTGQDLPAPNAEDFAATQKMFANQAWGMAWVCPRGIGPTAFAGSEKKLVQIRRRYMLLGQTIDGMRVWDIRRAIQTMRANAALEKTPMWLQSSDVMSTNTLYASLFEPDIARLDLYNAPMSHRDGPIYLNVSRVFDMPRAMLLAASRSKLRVYGPADSRWTQFDERLKSALVPAEQFQFRTLPPAN